MALLLCLAVSAGAAQVSLRVESGDGDRTARVTTFDRNRVTYVPLGDLVRQLGGAFTPGEGRVEVSFGNDKAVVAVGRDDVSGSSGSYKLFNDVLRGNNGEAWIALEDVASFFTQSFGITPEQVDPDAEPAPAPPAEAESQPQPELPPPPLPELEENVALPDLPTDVRPQQIPIVVIDPGHGGNDRGVEGQSLIEEDYALALSQRLQQALARVGVEARLTRIGDEAVPLINRINAAIQYGGRMLISLHAGASYAGDASGFEIFYPSDTGLGEAGSGPRAVNAVEQYRFAQESRILAEAVAQSLQQQTEAPLRGVHAVRSPLLQRVPMPGLLIEAGMLTSPSDENRIKDVAYQERFAAAVADAVRRHLGVPTEVSQPQPEVAPASEGAAP